MCIRDRVYTHEIPGGQLSNLRQQAIALGLGDRFEGSNENNDILRALADEYDVPLWEFDRLADTLPGRGLDTDGVHLIIDELPHDYTDPAAFQRGHAMQDLSALVVLDQVRRVIEEE